MTTIQFDIYLCFVQYITVFNWFVYNLCHVMLNNFSHDVGKKRYSASIADAPLKEEREREREGVCVGSSLETYLKSALNMAGA